MLGISDIDLKETRFYQDVHPEGQQLGEIRILRQLLTRRFGALPAKAPMDYLAPLAIPS